MVSHGILRKPSFWENVDFSQMLLFLYKLKIKIFLIASFPPELKSGE
jgi:hypothetical protein